MHPSDVITWPFINDDSFPAKNTARLAISSGVPKRISDISSVRTSLSSGVKHWFIFVSITPQEMAFTLIPLGPNSLAIAFVNEFTAPFVAEYTASHEAPRSPHIEDMFIIMPDLWLTIFGTAK